MKGAFQTYCLINNRSHIHAVVSFIQFIAVSRNAIKDLVLNEITVGNKKFGTYFIVRLLTLLLKLE